MELYLFTPRQSSGAAGPAVDAGGFDRVKKLPVCFFIAGYHCPPLIFVGPEFPLH
jgi:hypothetical protein